MDPSPQVLRALSSCTAAQRDFFEQVRSILEENPYRFRDIIHKDVDGRGRIFYQYYNGVIPLVFTYRVYPAEEDWKSDDPGYVSITRAERPWW